MANKAISTRELARRCIDKQQRGEATSRRERDALTRVKREQTERALEEGLREFPRKLYYRLTGSHWRQLKKYASLYGVPLTGPAIDLCAVLQWMHNMLETRGDALLDAEGVPSPALEKMREEKFKILRLERLHKEGELLPTIAVQAVFNEVATHLRKSEETLDRRFGVDAGDVVRAHLDAAEKSTMRMLASSVEPEEPDATPTNGQSRSS